MLDFLQYVTDSTPTSLIKVNELRKFRAIWYMGIPYIPHYVIVKPLKKCAQIGTDVAGVASKALSKRT